jgi:arylsulfatase A-like enzyme
VLLAGCSSRSPDILLVTLDTTRADALGVYGASPSPTPVLDGLAATAVVFEEAETVTPLTLPAHTSILTGLRPTRHGVRRNGVERLDTKVETLAERLHGAGYHTAAFVSAAILDRAFGLDQGFDTYEGTFATAETPGPVVPSHDADVATDAFARWLLHERDDAPLFAWVHYYDAHLPNVVHGNGFADPYQSELAFVDERVGRLLDALRAVARDRPLVVAIVGDHGEGRGDHGEETHGWFVYRPTTHVPLLLVAPGQAPRRVDGPVSVVDVAPTLLALAGVPVPADLDGRDLFAPTTTPEIVYGETFTPRDTLGFAELRFAQDARHRYILGPRPELYDWRADPGETVDLGAADPAAEPLRRFLAAVGEGRTGAGVAAAGDLGAQLAALGYTDAPSPVPANVSYRDLPDPKDEPGALATVDFAIHRARTVPPAEGVPVLEAALARYPRAGALRATLSRGYELLGRLDEAVAVVAPEGPVTDPSLLLRRASLRLAQERLPEAEALVAEAEAHGGSTDEVCLVRAEIRRRQGRPADALAAAQQGLAGAPDSSPLLLVAGTALTDLGRFGDAVPLLERSLAADHGGADVRFVLALALAETGDLGRARTLLAEQRDRFGATGAVDIALAKVDAAGGEENAAIGLLEAREGDPALDWQAALLLADLSVRQGAPAAVVERRVARAEALGAPAEAVAGLRGR